MWGHQSYLTSTRKENSQSEVVDPALFPKPYHGLALGHLDWGADGLLLLCCLGNHHSVSTEVTSYRPWNWHCSFLIRDEGNFPRRRSRKTVFPYAPLHDDNQHQDPESPSVHAVQSNTRTISLTQGVDSSTADSLLAVITRQVATQPPLSTCEHCVQFPVCSSKGWI